MNAGDCQPTFFHGPGNVHQAATVSADDTIGTGLKDVVYLIGDHGAGNFRLLDGKCSTEATAFGFPFKGYQGQHCQAAAKSALASLITSISRRAWQEECQVTVVGGPVSMS